MIAYHFIDGVGCCPERKFSSQNGLVNEEFERIFNYRADLNYSPRFKVFD